MIAFPKEIINNIKSFIPRDDSFKSPTADIIKEYLLYMKDANKKLCRRCFNPPPIILFTSFPDFILSRRGKWFIEGWYKKRIPFLEG
jgi:hypothetical protein